MSPKGARTVSADFSNFEDFFRSTFPGVLATALLLCGNRQDAEDAVQEAYTDALRRWDRISGYEAPEAWVRLVMRQRLWRTMRRRGNQISATGVDPELAASLQAAPELTAEARAALDALGGLPPHLRYVVVMHCLYAVPQQTLADELNISRSAIGGRIFTARRLLEKTLGMVTAGRRDTELWQLMPSSRVHAELQFTDPLAGRLREGEQSLRDYLAGNDDAVQRALTAVKQQDRRGRLRMPAFGRRSLPRATTDRLIPPPNTRRPTDGQPTDRPPTTQPDAGGSIQ